LQKIKSTLEEYIMLDRLKVLARITGDVLAGRSMSETILPRMRNHVVCEIIRADGSRLMVDGYNSRVNAGASWQAYQMGAQSGLTTTGANYVALSTTNITPAATDTTLSGEVTFTGLSRQQGTFTYTSTPASLSTSAQYTISKTFTSAFGSATTIQSAALFTAGGPPPAGVLFVEAAITQATLNSGDQLVLTWTVNI
jgi:hypothetical protein